VEYVTNMRKNLADSWTRGTFIAGGFVLAVALVNLLFHSPAAYAQLQAWKLIPTPESYTELYFDHNLTLPSVVTDKPITFAFGIHNAQGQTMIYPYTVTIVSANGTIRPLAHGLIAIADAATATIPEAIGLTAGTTNAEISVDLPNQHQEIHFWLGAAK
jgi:hypothetical protein